MVEQLQASGLLFFRWNLALGQVGGKHEQLPVSTATNCPHSLTDLEAFEKKNPGRICKVNTFPT